MSGGNNLLITPLRAPASHLFITTIIFSAFIFLFSLLFAINLSP